MRTLRWTPLLLIYACAGMGESPPPPSGGGAFGTATSGSDDVKEEVVVTSGRGGGGSWGAKRSVPTAPGAAPDDAPSAREPGPVALRDSTTTALPPATERPPVDAPPPPPPPGVGDTYGPRHEDAVIRDLGARTDPRPSLELDTRPAPASPGVQAGASDDNLAFGAWLRFLDENPGHGLARDISERVVVTVKDEAGRPLAGARVSLVDGERTLAVRSTYADGRALLFPSEGPRPGQGARVKVSYQAEAKEILLAGVRGHRLDVQLPLRREAAARVPLDVAFVLDTTGSMGDELAQLKATLEVIHFQISNLSPRPDVRFGMVLYRDVGDDYRAQVIPFTADLAAFQRALAAVQAGGGGDYPEDVQEGLRRTMQELEWREAGVRLAFLVGDAPPHLDYAQPYTYLDATADAARRGIKITTVGASGLDRTGEVVWRQVAQYTMAPFVFLTYGEKGNAEGSASTVSHHVGSNWVAESLDAIVVRMVKTEVAHYAEKGAQESADYFTAGRSMRVPADDVLEDLFARCVKQLVDYAVVPIDAGTPTVLLPLSGARGKRAGKRLEHRLSLGLARMGQFRLVERDAVPKLLDTLAEQLSETYDEAKVAEVGRLVPAKLAVLGQVEPPAGEGPYEVLVKLVRIETGEVLSLSLLKIDRALLM